MKSVAAAAVLMASVASAFPQASAPVTPSASTTPGSAMTTKTIYDTQTHTVTSCAPTVTNCPAGPHVTVVTVPVTTTVCPVTQEFSVSTVYQTQTYVVTKCPATVTNCPVGKTTTQVVPTVTVCPVTSAPSGPKSTNAPVVPGQTKTLISGPVGSNSTAGVAQPTGGASNPTTSGKPSGPISLGTTASVSSFLAAAGVAVALFQLC